MGDILQSTSPCNPPLLTADEEIERYCSNVPKSLLPHVQNSNLSSGLDIYIRQISGTKLLTADQEKQLATQIQFGDESAKHHLVRSNLRLVVRIARSYRNKGLPIHDLIQEGNIGLMRAADLFDPAEDVRFSTYASIHVKAVMRRAIVNMGRTVRVPAYLVERAGKWKMVEKELAEKFGKLPTDSEIGKVLDLTPKQIEITRDAIYALAMRQAGESEELPPIIEIMPDEGSADSGDMLDLSEGVSSLLTRIRKLDERSRFIIRKSFGINGNEVLNSREIADLLGISKERVRQIKDVAIESMRRDEERVMGLRMEKSAHLTPGHRAILIDLIAGYPSHTATQIARKFEAKTGRPISKYVVCRVRKVGYTRSVDVVGASGKSGGYKAVTI